MTVASFVISCLAAVAAVGAMWYARGQKRAAEQSAVEAKRSADAAAEMARIEQDRRSEEVAEADRHRVRFELVPRGGNAYLLHNAGTDSAYGVHVDTGSLGAAGQEEDFDEFPSGGAEEYLLARTYGDPDHIAITWHSRPDLSDAAHSAKLYGP